MLHSTISEGFILVGADVQYKTVLISSSNLRDVWSDLCQVCNRSLKVASVCKEVRLMRMYNVKLSSVGLPSFRLWLACFIYLLSFGALLVFCFLIVGVILWGKHVDTECGVECVQYSSVGPLNTVKWPFHYSVGSSYVTKERERESVKEKFVELKAPENLTSNLVSNVSL